MSKFSVSKPTVRQKARGQDPTIVAIARRAVVHSVVERSVENVFQNAQAATQFCVNPELVQCVELCMYPELRHGGTDSRSTRLQGSANDGPVGIDKQMLYSLHPGNKIDSAGKTNARGKEKIHVIMGCKAPCRSAVARL